MEFLKVNVTQIERNGLPKWASLGVTLGIKWTSQHFYETLI